MPKNTLQAIVLWPIHVDKILTKSETVFILHGMTQLQSAISSGQEVCKKDYGRKGGLQTDKILYVATN